MEHKTASFDWDIMYYSAETGLFHYDFGYRIGQKVRVKKRYYPDEPYRTRIYEVVWICPVPLFDPDATPENVYHPCPYILVRRYTEDSELDDYYFDPVSKRVIWYEPSDYCYCETILVD